MVNIALAFCVTSIGIMCLTITVVLIKEAFFDEESPDEDPQVKS